MNSPFVIAQAEAIASAAPASNDEAERVAWLYARVLGREPNEDERLAAREFLQAARDAAPDATSGAAPAIWTQLAQVLLASNEFFYVD